MSKALVRSAAPDFSGNAVVNGEFTTIKLSDYKGKWLVLFFYPLGWSIDFVLKTAYQFQTSPSCARLRSSHSREFS